MVGPPPLLIHRRPDQNLSRDTDFSTSSLNTSRWPLPDIPELPPPSSRRIPQDEGLLRHSSLLKTTTVLVVYIIARGPFELSTRNLRFLLSSPRRRRRRRALVLLSPISSNGAAAFSLLSGGADSISIASSSCSSLSSSPSLKSAKMVVGWTRRSGIGAVRCSVETAVPAIRQVTEVDKDSFWPIVRSAGAKTVVLDVYTRWCGPCKVMAPKFRELSGKYSDVISLKLDCNQDSKPLAKELGIRVVPTFKILRDDKVIKEVTGAKFDDLVLAIETGRSS